MEINRQHWIVDSVNLESLSKDIREHNLAGPCEDAIEELMSACANFLYGTVTDKKIVVSFGLGKSYEKDLNLAPIK